MTKRTTYNYTLKNGNQTVYQGITNDPSRRMAEHVQSGKEFTSMVHTTYPTTRETARAREASGLEHYRATHDGINPKYNKTNHG